MVLFRLNIVQIECNNYTRGLETDLLQEVIKRFKENCSIFFIFTTTINGIWKGRTFRKFWEETDKDGRRVRHTAILCLESEGPPYWLTSLSGHVFSPRPQCTRIVFIFATGTL